MGTEVSAETRKKAKMLIAISDFGQFSLIGVSENERPLFLINSLFGPQHNI